MFAIQDVREGDVIDIRILCKAGESGTANVSVAVMDDALFRLGYEILSDSAMQLTSFSNTLVEGTINCSGMACCIPPSPRTANGTPRWMASPSRRC